MQHFIKRGFIFFIILIIWFAVNATINYLIIKYSNPEIIKTNILITGDSHTLNGINPAKFKNAQNISQLAESYVLTYWKLKKIFTAIKPDTVIIAFGPHNLSQLDDYRFSTDKWTDEMFIRSYMIQEFKYLHTIEIDFNKFYYTLFKNMCLFPKLHHNNYIGSFVANPLNEIGNFSNTIKRHYGDEKPYTISQTSLNYLDSIIVLCKKNKITPIFVNCPVHKNYYQAIPSKFKESYDAEKQKLSKLGILVIDMFTLPLPDAYFLDDDHLNVKGSTYFTNELIKQLHQRTP